eukprot:scaffold135160_cov34-Tisochrysis_lutea.AAC.2
MASVLTASRAAPCRILQDCTGHLGWVLYHGLHWLLREAHLHSDQQHHRRNGLNCHGEAYSALGVLRRERAARHRKSSIHPRYHQQGKCSRKGVEISKTTRRHPGLGHGLALPCARKDISRPGRDGG